MADPNHVTSHITIEDLSGPEVEVLVHSAAQGIGNAALALQEFAVDSAPENQAA